MQVPVLINDRLDVALITGADGVHVGQGDLPAAAVRRMLAPGMILGVSVKTVQEAQQAQADGADYLGAGASVFFTSTPPPPPPHPPGLCSDVRDAPDDGQDLCSKHVCQCAALQLLSTPQCALCPWGLVRALQRVSYP